MQVTRPFSLADDGRFIVEQLGGRWAKKSGLCRCPAHDDSTPSLSVRIGRSRLLFHCFAGCSASAILKALQLRGLLAPSAPFAHHAAPFAPEPRNLANLAARLWAEARLIADTPAEHYLHARGIKLGFPDLRYHPRAPLGPWPLTQFRPALLAAVRDGERLVGIHRTFLDASRATIAALPQAKLGLGRFGTGAVRLSPAGPRLGIAEGVETALSATLLFGIPCWATLGTERFGRVALPEVSELVLFLDHDQGGRRAELIARAAYGSSVSITARYPRQPGQDWNDVLRERAAAQARGEAAAGV